jgi:quinoprotein dehydrogenase-associated probable ABC transporter substrate-binding protein
MHEWLIRRFARRARRDCLPAVIAAGLAMAPVPALAQSAGLGAAGELVDPEVLRVCADPSNMPFSDESEEGFENKLAELVARKLGRTSVSYTWFPTATGFVRRTLGEYRCDLIMGYAQGDELVQNTNAYYRSAYALIYQKGSGLDGVESISDPELKTKRIGVVAGTPPAANMAAAKLMRNARPYHLMVDTRLLDSVGETMVRDILAGKIDAGILWGPIAGYYAHQAEPDLEVVPLLKENAGSRMAYRITMGVRPSDQEWKRELNRFIRENQAEINKILLDYNVPLIDEQDNLITQ